MGVVNDVLESTPAQGAGLAKDDRILQVDGQSFAGRQLRDMACAIRGREGAEVVITILRGAEVFSVTIVRARIGMTEAEATMLDGGMALVAIHSFTQHTPDTGGSRCPYTGSRLGTAGPLAARR